jgi:hypothetical protein
LAEQRINSEKAFTACLAGGHGKEGKNNREKIPLLPVGSVVFFSG